MDVGCPKCQTEYELDDARVPEGGVTVKCTTCAHIFRVKRKSLIVTLPVRADDARALEATAPSELPPPPPAREWKVRQPNGRMLACRELTALQKWIIENKVSREDEISLTGDTWKKLGDIPELASFFQIVDQAAKARTLEAIHGATPVPMSPMPPPPPPAAKITETWKEPNFVSQFPPEGTRTEDAMPAVSMHPPPPPPPSNPPPPPRSRDTGKLFPTPPPLPKSDTEPTRLYEPSESQLRQAVGGSSGKGKWIALIGLLAGGGLAAWYFGVYAPQHPAQPPGPVVPATVTPPTPVPVPVPVAEDAGAPDAGLPDAGAPDAGPPDAGPPDAGAPDAPDAGQPAVVEDAGAPAVAVVPQPPRTFEAVLAQADQMRERERAEAALNLYGRAHEMKPERAEPLAGRGLALLDLGNAPVAESAFEQALKVNDRYAPALMGMAESLRLQGKKARAIEFYQRYLDVLPDGSEAAVARNNIERLKP